MKHHLKKIITNTFDTLLQGTKALVTKVSSVSMVIGSIFPSLLAWFIQCFSLTAAGYFIYRSLSDYHDEWLTLLIYVIVTAAYVLIAILSGEFIRRELRGGES